MRRCVGFLRTPTAVCSRVRYFSEAAAAPKQDQAKIWTFLSGFGQETHAKRFNSWAELQRAKKHHLVEMGIEKPQARKLILRKIEGWKQEQRYKLHLLQQAGRAGDIVASAEGASREQYAKYLESVTESTGRQEKHKLEQEASLREKQDAALVRRIERIQKGLPVQQPRFPRGHPLDGLSEAQVPAVHAGYLHDMYRTEDGQVVDKSSKHKMLMEAKVKLLVEKASVDPDPVASKAYAEIMALLEDGTHPNLDAVYAARPDLQAFVDAPESKHLDQMEELTEMLKEFDTESTRVRSHHLGPMKDWMMKLYEDDGYPEEEIKKMREQLDSVSPADLGVEDVTEEEASDDMDVSESDWGEDEGLGNEGLDVDEDAAEDTFEDFERGKY